MGNTPLPQMESDSRAGLGRAEYPGSGRAFDTMRAGTGGIPWLARVPVQRWEPGFLLMLGVLLAGLLLPLLGRAPRAYVDDSWSTMAGYTLAFEGRPRNPGQMGRGGTDIYLVQPRLFPNVVCAAVYRVAGFGLVPGRAVAAGFGALFVFGVYAVMRRLFGPVAAAVVAVMVAVDPWVFLTGRTCREEIFLAALLWWSWWLLLDGLDRGSVRRAFLGGLLTGLAGWTHPNALVFSVAALIALTVLLGRGLLDRRWLAFVILGATVGAMPYLAYVLFVQATTDVRLMEQVAERTGAYARSFAAMWTVEATRWSEFLRLPARLPLLIMYAWGALWIALRGKRADRLLLLLVLLTVLLMPLAVRAAHARYLVVLVPALAAFIWRSLPIPLARANDSAGRVGPRMTRARGAKGITLAALGVYAAMSLLPSLAILYAHRHADYGRWVGRVAEHVPPGARVMGHTTYWIGLCDRRFISSIPPYFSDWRSEKDASEHICRYRPEYLIQSGVELSGVGGLKARSREMRGNTFARACEQVATQIPAHMLTEFYHPDFGGVRVWKLEWDGSPDDRPE